jgi:hypothetical protein
MRKRMRKRTEEEEESKAVPAILLLIPFSWVFAFSPPDPRKRLVGAGSIDIGACLPMITHVIGAARYILRRRSRSLFLGGGGLLLALLLLLSFLSGKGREAKGGDGMGKCISSVASLRPDKRRGAVIGERSGCLTVLGTLPYLRL